MAATEMVAAETAAAAAAAAGTSSKVAMRLAVNTKHTDPQRQTLISAERLLSISKMSFQAELEGALHRDDDARKRVEDCSACTTYAEFIKSVLHTALVDIPQDLYKLMRAKLAVLEIRDAGAKIALGSEAESASVADSAAAKDCATYSIEWRKFPHSVGAFQTIHTSQLTSGIMELMQDIEAISQDFKPAQRAVTTACVTVFHFLAASKLAQERVLAQGWTAVVREDYKAACSALATTLSDMDQDLSPFVFKTMKIIEKLDREYVAKIFDELHATRN